jgi:hypothetical protein
MFIQISRETMLLLINNSYIKMFETILVLKVFLALLYPVHEVRFDQKKMRSHLLSCFEKRELTHFPQARRQPATQSRQHNNVTIATLCECKLPEEYDNMILCDLCGKWFHFGCVGYDTSISNEWLCRLCTPPAAKKPKLCM